MANFVIDDVTGLPVPTIGFLANINARLKILGYDSPSGLEYDWGCCAHAVSIFVKHICCLIPFLKLTITSGMC